MNKVDYESVERPMTKADKELWVSALRSGDYKQYHGELFDVTRNSYCCLGVANKVLNLQSSSPALLRSTSSSINSCLIPELEQAVLYEMNDYGSKSFPEIADYIEANIPAVDE